MAMTIERILAERLPVPEDGPMAEGSYRIFVRDLELSSSIGAYAHERLRPQRIRINLDIRVRAAGRPLNDDLTNVLSYDAVIAAIKRLVADGHINLVETLAERIAEICLADSRVTQVSVRVEKLEVVPDAAGVGVEIERRRSTGAEVLPLASADAARTARTRDAR
ncbi:MAG: dihydroneopterin aldolase [Dongiaceae bacterium]